MKQNVPPVYLLENIHRVPLAVCIYVLSRNKLFVWQELRMNHNQEIAVTALASLGTQVFRKHLEMDLQSTFGTGGDQTCACLNSKDVIVNYFQYTDEKLKFDLSLCSTLTGVVVAVTQDVLANPPGLPCNNQYYAVFITLPFHFYISVRTLRHIENVIYINKRESLFVCHDFSVENRFWTVLYRYLHLSPNTGQAGRRILLSLLRCSLVFFLLLSLLSAP